MSYLLKRVLVSVNSYDLSSRLMRVVSVVDVVALEDGGVLDIGLLVDPLGEHAG